MKEAIEIVPAGVSRDVPVPALVAQAGLEARERFFEFFAAQIRNRNTRAAYLQATHQFFAWCEGHGLALRQIRPLHVAAYVEGQQRALSAPSIKQHLAGLRMLFNWLVIGQVLPSNPALFVKGPKFSRQVGITPVLEAAQMRDLLDSIEMSSLKGLRDRAAIALMAYTFARVSAVVLLLREDYRVMGKCPQLRLQEKGGKEKLVWLHHEAEEFLDRYLERAGITEPKAPLFQTLDKFHRLTGRESAAAIYSAPSNSAVRTQACQRPFAITLFVEPALPCFCKTAARSKPRKIWQITPTRAPRNSTTGAKISPP